LIQLIDRTHQYYLDLNNTFFLPKIAMLFLEYLYYHYSPSLDLQADEKRKDEKEVIPVGRVGELATYLYKHGSPRERTQALLCHVYHYCIHNRFTEARDVFLMSHVQENINDADVRIRILFNRTMAQLGLSAFRTGEYRHALSSLADFYPQTRIKELLAQGISRSNYTERNMEKENRERRRQYPAHMHINIDMIEAMHLLSAAFDEIPNMAMYGANKKKIISKTFRNHFQHYLKQPFPGPPENTRDNVMAFSAALQRGDWKKGLNKYIWTLRVWDLVPSPEVVKAKLQRKVQEVALRTFLLTYGTQYSSISMEALQEMSELEPAVIHRIVSEMIHSDQLHGAWDQPTNTIIMYEQEPSRLQKEALIFAERAAAFVDQNDRLLNPGGGGGGGGFFWDRDQAGPSIAGG
jgi:hypothetical protein